MKLENIVNKGKEFGKSIKKHAPRVGASVLFTIMPSIAEADTPAGAGILESKNHFNSSFYDPVHTLYHDEGASEGYVLNEDVKDGGSPPLEEDVTSKIVSIVEGYKLNTDGRPLDSNSPVNIELSLHSQDGNPIEVNNLENEIRFSLPYADSGWDFGNQPITMWEKDVNDPNILYFMGDVRSAINNSNNISGDKGAIPVGTLDGTYESEEPYFEGQIRFDTFTADLNLDDKVNFKDFAYLSDDWMNHADVNGVPYSIANISGPNGIPDFNSVTGKAIVDGYDLKAFSGEWLSGE